MTTLVVFMLAQPATFVNLWEIMPLSQDPADQATIALKVFMSTRVPQVLTPSSAPMVSPSVPQCHQVTVTLLPIIHLFSAQRVTTKMNTTTLTDVLSVQLVIVAQVEAAVT